MPDTPEPPYEDLLDQVPSGRRRLARTFLRRVMPFLLESIRDAGADQLREALEAPTSAGSLARFLTRVAGAEAIRALDPLAEASARAAEIQEQLLVEAGGTWAADEVARHLGISRQAVHQRRRRGTLLAVESRGKYQFPLCQFTETGTVDGLGQVLQAIATESSWTRLSVLLSPTVQRASDDEERSILDALKAGHVDDALYAARAWGRPGA